MKIMCCIYYSPDLQDGEIVPCCLRAQPLHESQEETERSVDSSVFTYYLRPSFDFFQKILWMREKVEILSPADVRKEMTDIIKRLSTMYL